MPRTDKIFGKRSHGKAYGEGTHESKKSGFWGDIKQEFSKGVDKTISDTRSSQEKSYDAGWEEGKGLRDKYRKDRYEGLSSKDIQPGRLSDLLILIVIAAVLIGGAALALNYSYQSVRQDSGATTASSQSTRGKTSISANGIQVQDRPENGIGGIRYVNTEQINVRSGPGTKYQIVRKAFKGEKILVYGHPEGVDGEEWSVSIGNDPSTRGWVNLKYVSTNEPSRAYAQATPKEPVVRPEKEVVNEPRVTPGIDKNGLGYYQKFADGTERAADKDGNEVVRGKDGQFRRTKNANKAFSNRPVTGRVW